MCAFYGQANQRNPSVADRRASELLRQLEGDEGLSRRGGGESNQAANSDDVLKQRLMEQVEKADDLLREKDRTIGQLEQKLAAQQNQRERAEAR